MTLQHPMCCFPLRAERDVLLPLCAHTILQADLCSTDCEGTKLLSHPRTLSTCRNHSPIFGWWPWGKKKKKHLILMCIVLYQKIKPKNNFFKHFGIEN